MLKRTAMKFVPLVLFSLTLLVAGCGGDGRSSSGSGGSTGGTAGGGTSPPVNLAALSGNYNGSARVTLSAFGINETVNSSVRATVASGGRLTINFGDDAIATGQLAADGSFRITDTLANAGIDDCSGNVIIAGRVAGSSMNASINSSGARCSGISATATGSLNATRT
jgi:hypothetical protein